MKNILARTAQLKFWAVFFIVALAACPRPIPPPAPMPPDGMTACPANLLPVAEDVCDRYYLIAPAADGTHPACSVCPPGAEGCFAAAYSVYCVAGRSCTDPRCRVDLSN